MSKYKTFTAEVDVDLSDWDTDAIIDEIIARSNPKHYDALDSKEYIRLLKGVKLAPVEEPKGFKNTLVGQMKRELFVEYQERFSVEDFEDFLRDKGVILKSSAAYGINKVA